MLPPIVSLHHVSEGILNQLFSPFCITHRIFWQLLNYLQRNHYDTITFAQIVADTQILNTPSKKNILTFDDCSKMLWEFAIPELSRRNLKAVFFMPTAYISGYNEWYIEKGIHA